MLCALWLAACAPMSSLPSQPAEAVALEGYLSTGLGLRLYSTLESRSRGSNQDCIQVIGPETRQSEPLPASRVRVSGRLGVFDDIAALAKIQIGSDHATHELCEARYLIVTDIAPESGTGP